MICVNDLTWNKDSEKPKNTTSNAQGLYNLIDIDPGAKTFRITHTDYRVKTEQKNIIGGLNTFNFSLDAIGTGTINGYVFEQTTPLANVLVEINQRTVSTNRRCNDRRRG